MNDAGIMNEDMTYEVSIYILNSIYLYNSIIGDARAYLKSRESIKGSISRPNWGISNQAYFFIIITPK